MPNISWMLRKYIDDLFDPTTGHAHDGSDSAKINWLDLNTGGASSKTSIRGDGGGGASTYYFYDQSDINNNFARVYRSYSAGSISLTTSYQDIKTIAPDISVADYNIIVRFTGKLVMSRDTSSLLSNLVPVDIKLVRDTTDVQEITYYPEIDIDEANENISSVALDIPLVYAYVDSGQTGTPTYKFQAKVADSSITASISHRTIELTLTKK